MRDKKRVGEGGIVGSRSYNQDTFYEKNQFLIKEKCKIN